MDFVLAGDGQVKMTLSPCGNAAFDASYAVSPRLVGLDAGVDQNNDDSAFSRIEVERVWQPGRRWSCASMEVNRNPQATGGRPFRIAAQPRIDMTRKFAAVGEFSGPDDAENEPRLERSNRHGSHVNQNHWR